METPRSTLRILVVDDRADLLDAQARLLQAVGCVVLTAGAPQEALEIAKRTPLDAVLVDATLRPMNGVALLDEIRCRCPHVAAVLTSGFRPGQLEAMGIEVGRYAYLPKPAPVADVLVTIREAVASNQPIRDLPERIG